MLQGLKAVGLSISKCWGDEKSEGKGQSWGADSRF